MGNCINVVDESISISVRNQHQLLLWAAGTWQTDHKLGARTPESSAKRDAAGRHEQESAIGTGNESKRKPESNARCANEPIGSRSHSREARFEVRDETSASEDGINALGTQCAVQSSVLEL